MKFKLVLLVITLGVLGGAGYGLRTYLHNSDPAVKAERLAADGKLRDALVEFRNASRADPKDAGVHLRIGQIQAKLADPVAAEREFRIAIQLGADRAAVIPDLGEAILVQGRFRDVLREVPARGPTPAIAAKDLLLRAVAQLSLNDVPAAQATLAEAQARAPDEADTALIAVRLAAAQNDLPSMRKDVAEVLRRDPHQVEALLMQTKLQAMAGDRAGALASVDKAVAAAPWSAMARIDRASQYMLADDDAKAQADVNAVLSAQPRFMDAVYLNAILMARRGQFNEAAVQFSKLDTVAGRLPQGLYFQSLIAEQQGNLQTAADFAQRYNALVPQDPDGMRAVGRTELALGRPLAALPVLQKLTADAPKDAQGFDMLGRAYAAVGKGPEAAKAFDTAVGLAPNDPLVLYHVGAQLLQTGHPQEALVSLGKAFTVDPKVVGLGPALVEALLGVGEPAKAEATLAKVRAATGESEELSRLAAVARVRQNDLPGARALLVESVKKYPNSLDLRTQLALLLNREGRPSEALPLLSAVLAKSPANFPALSAFIDIEAAENDLPAALKALEAAHKDAPRDTAITAMLADGLTANKDPQGAVDLVRNTGADSAVPPLLAGALGRAQVALGHPDDAKATYRAALAEHPDNLLLRGSLAALLTSDKDYAGVQATLGEALALFPGNYSLMSGLVANEGRWKGLDAAAKLADSLRAQPGTLPFSAALKGDLYMAANRPAEAVTAYRAEYDQGPTLPLLFKTTGAMAQANQVDPAIQLLSGWLKSHKDDVDVSQRLAQLDIQAGRFADAQVQLAAVLAARPDDALALNNMAWCYFETGDSRALATAQRAYLRGPTPQAADTLGWILVKSGSAKAAVPLLQRAAEGGRDPSVQFHLAAALSDDGRPAEALPVLQKLLDGPAFPEQDDARKLAASLKGGR